jgi:hypothetical protein
MVSMILLIKIFIVYLYGGTVFNSLSTILCSFHVSQSVMNELPCRLSRHALQYVYSLVTTRHRLVSSMFRVGIGLMLLLGDQNWPPYYTQAFSYVTKELAMEAVIHTCQAFLHKPAHATNVWMVH